MCVLALEIWWIYLEPSCFEKWVFLSEKAFQFVIFRTVLTVALDSVCVLTLFGFGTLTCLFLSFLDFISWSEVGHLRCSRLPSAR